jgi:hypothetical protein
VVGLLLELIGFFGQQDSLRQLIEAIPVAAWAYNPWVAGIFMILGTGVICLVYGDWYFEHRLARSGGFKGKEYPARFENWDRISAPAVWQIAWLWENLEPQGEGSDGTPAYPRFQKLKEDLNNGVIKDVAPAGDSWTQTKIERQKLIDYAFEIGERPAFLFRDQRIPIPIRIVKELFRKRRTFSPDIARNHVRIWDIQLANYEEYKENMEELKSKIQKELIDGSWLAIGRRKIDGLLYDYEKIPRRNWRIYDLNSFDDRNRAENYYDDIRLIPIKVRGDWNVAR